MPSTSERINSIVARGTRTRRTAGGWQLDNIRFAVYPDGHLVLASLDRSGEDKPVVHASNREIMHRLIDQVMDAMEARVLR